MHRSNKSNEHPDACRAEGMFISFLSLSRYHGQKAGLPRLQFPVSNGTEAGFCIWDWVIQLSDESSTRRQVHDDAPTMTKHYLSLAEF